MIIIENGKKYIVTVKENGDKFWYLDNKLHREEGPAVELVSGAKVFYLQGVKFASEGDFKNHLKKIIKTAEIKKYFDVKVETMLPATLTYKVLAKDAEEAALLIKNMQPNHIRHRLAGRRDLKLMVYDVGSSMIRYVKNLAGF